MSKLVFANVDYRQHVTDEGDQLQRSLEFAGWKLVGAGYEDGCRDVPTLIDRYQPEAVLVSDRRDWDPKSPGSFRKDIGFARLEELAKHQSILKIATVKDAGSVQDYHHQFCRDINADAVLTYYHEESVAAVAPFLKNYPLVRTYHTIDKSLAESIDLQRPRNRALVSGAVSRVYPLRSMAVQEARHLGLDVLRHPGYSNSGARTPAYLKSLSGYRVHLACSSAYGFALRKIVESVAMGCTVVTDLPEYDVLPEIDGALVRVKPSVSMSELRRVIDDADAGWNL